MSGKVKSKKPLVPAGRRQLYGYAFIAPWLIGLVAIFAVPLVKSVIFAFCEVKMNPAATS